MAPTAANIKEHWDSIKNSLNEICTIDCRPEDIYAACVNGKAFLFMNEEGFCVLQERQHPMTFKKELFVWAAYTKSQGAFEWYIDWLEEIKKNVGAKSIAFITKRRGFEKTLGPEWSVRSVVYEKRD